MLESGHLFASLRQVAARLLPIPHGLPPRGQECAGVVLASSRIASGREGVFVLPKRMHVEEPVG